MMIEQVTYRPHAAIARVLSDVLSPPVLAVPGLILAAWMCHDSRAIGYALCYLLVAVVAPLLYVVWMFKTGRINDIHLPNRSDRTLPFLINLLGGAAAVALLVQLGAPGDFLAPILALLAQTLLLFAITLLWQVSIHTATVAGVAMLSVMALGEGCALLFLLVPLVAWARIYLGRHTIAQTVVGAAIGVSCFALVPALRMLV